MPLDSGRPWEDILYQEFDAQLMIENAEFIYLFAVGAVLILSLVLYNKFGKVKEQ